MEKPLTLADLNVLSDTGAGPVKRDELAALWDSESEDEFDDYQRERREASMAFHMHRRHGKQLPLLAGVLRELTLKITLR